MANIVIIGAGLTGISTAYHLEQQNFFDYILFEKEQNIGGLCGSVYQDGYTFDFTGHLLHVSDNYFESLIKDVVGFENMNQIKRRSFIFSHNTYTKYPFQINMYGLPTNVIVECIEGFVNRKNKKGKSFYDWTISNFGNGIASHFFIPFQTKILSYDIKKVTSTWTGRFVPKTSLGQMLAGSLQDQSDDIGYNSNFYYPKNDGIFYWVKKLAQKLENRIQTGFELETIDVKNKILIFKNGHIETYNKLISTVPLDIFLNKIIEPSDIDIKKYSKKLICNSVINFNIGVKDRNISDKHWIYFPEDKYPFYRLGFPHNFSQNATPLGCSSLYGEMSYISNNKKDANSNLLLSLKETKKLLKINENEIETEKIINIDRAYVIYDFWREKNLTKILKTLEDLHILSIGRYGQWKYSSMQEAVLDGKSAAELIINHDLEIKVDLNNYKEKNL